MWSRARSSSCRIFYHLKLCKLQFVTRFGLGPSGLYHINRFAQSQGSPDKYTNLGCATWRDCPEAAVFRPSGRLPWGPRPAHGPITPRAARRAPGAAPSREPRNCSRRVSGSKPRRFRLAHFCFFCDVLPLHGTKVARALTPREGEHHDHGRHFQAPLCPGDGRDLRDQRVRARRLQQPARQRGRRLRQRGQLRGRRCRHHHLCPGRRPARPRPRLRRRRRVREDHVQHLRHAARL